MKKSSFTQTLRQVRDSGDYQALDAYKDPDFWEELDQGEKEELADLFLSWGEVLLCEGDSRVFEVLEVAGRLLPEDADIALHRGEILSINVEDARCLKSAEEAFEQAIDLRPRDARAWFYLGEVLFDRLILEHEEGLLDQAEENFHTAESLIDDSDELALFYCSWGRCWQRLGEDSGELHDYSQALSKYQLAQKYGMEAVSCLRDQAQVMFHMAMLIMDNEEALAQVVEAYRRVLLLSPDMMVAWREQAQAQHRLYERILDPFVFSDAEHSYRRAYELGDDSEHLVLNWAMLELNFGRRHRENEVLQQSIEKFQALITQGSNLPEAKKGLIEATISLGAEQERLDLLRDAQDLITEEYEEFPHDPDLRYLEGICQLELAVYFQDEEVIKGAIEVFREGLRLFPEHHRLWKGLGIAHYMLGRQVEDLHFLDAALSCFKRAEQHCPDYFNEFCPEAALACFRLGELKKDEGLVEEGSLQMEIILNEMQNRCGIVDLELLFYYGCSLDCLGDFSDESSYYAQSVHVLQEVISLDPDHFFARYHLAMALVHLGELEADADYFEQASIQFQNLVTQDGEDAQAWCEWGVCLVYLAELANQDGNQKDAHMFYEEAETRLLRAQALGGNQAYYQLACLYSLRGVFDKAMQYLEKSAYHEALPDADLLFSDDWIKGLRNTSPFKKFAEEYLDS